MTETRHHLPSSSSGIGRRSRRTKKTPTTIATTTKTKTTKTFAILVVVVAIASVVLGGGRVVQSFSPPSSFHRGATTRTTTRTTTTTSPSVVVRPGREVFVGPTTHAAVVVVVSSSSTSLDAAGLLPDFLDEETARRLVVLSYEKVIDAGVPALFFVLTTWWFLSAVRGGGGGDRGGYGGRGGGGGRGFAMMGRMMGGERRGGGGGGKRGGGGRRSSFDPYYDGGRPLGPVEELYDDIYDDLSGPGEDGDVPPIFRLFGAGGGRRGGGGYGNWRGGGGGGGNDFVDGPTLSRLNIGIPKRTYLRVTKLNSRYDSYRYSVVEATRGKAYAASELRARGFEDALRRAVGDSSSPSSYGDVGGGGGTSRRRLTSAEGTALLTLERDFLASGAGLVREAAAMTRAITNAAVLLEMEEMGIEAGSIDAIVDAEIVKDNDDRAVVTDAQRDFFGLGNTTTAKDDGKGEGGTGASRMKIEKKTDIMRAIKEVEAINTEILLLELDFVRSIVEVLGPDRADAVRATIVGNDIGGEAGTLLRTLKERPLATVLSSLYHGGTEKDGGVVNGHRRGNLFVTRFPGDVTASQLNELREEVTGILRSAQPGDEALLVLQSGGGTVTGYGLAAAQLQRFKAKGMKLTVCVEQVAASGGYMMCCTADRIVASPFAVLGSIGVISEIPNAYERLQREGIEFQTITAGKFKRTVTPTKKVTKEDIKKSKEDITEIFNLFKSFVKSQRPQLDIENVATGETWFGEDALERGLCDELGTADDVLLDFIDRGYDVYEVAYKPAPAGVSLLAGLPGGSGPSDGAVGGILGWRGILRSVVRGIVSDVKEEIVAELTSTVNDMNSVERRYMAQDDSADRIQIKD